MWTVAAIREALEGEDPDTVVAVGSLSSDRDAFEQIAIIEHRTPPCGHPVLVLRTSASVVAAGIGTPVPASATAGCPASPDGQHDTLGPARNETDDKGRITHGGATCSKCGQFSFANLFKPDAQA